MLVDYAETAYLWGFIGLQLCTSRTGASCPRRHSLFCSPALADVGVVHEWIFPSPVPSHGAPVIMEAVLISTTGLAAANSSCASEAAAVAVEKVAESTMEFLPLMLTSLYCALGIVWAWLRLSWVYLTS